MAAISDEYVVRVLRPFVGAAGPVLAGLRDADPFRLGRLAQRRALALESAEGAESAGGGTGAGGGGGDDAVVDLAPQARREPPAERDQWWVGRVGRVTSVIASVPGIGGALARRLPVSDIIGLAAQGLVVCAIAGEHGVTDRDEQVRLLAEVLFARRLDPTRHGDPHGADVERAAGELTGDLPGGRTAGPDAGLPDTGDRDGRLVALARAVWRMGRALYALHEELDRRPQGRLVWRVLANLPVVGAVASYRSERSGLKRAARAAVAWTAREHGAQR